MGGVAKTCVLQGAPLVVLRSVDMPAVLVEIGYLTHPVDENRLNDSEVLRKIAELISDAIDAFLAQKP